MKDSKYPIVGLALQEYRRVHGKTAEDMCQVLNVSRASYYRIEAGQIVKMETFEALATLLSTTVIELLRLEQSIEKQSFLAALEKPDLTPE